MFYKLLAGVKVIEYGNQISGPYCAKIFADLGADVIKIEEPGHGDDSRRLGPFPKDVRDPEDSGLYLYLNMNKRGITLDPGSKTGKAIFAELMRSCDVLIENNSPGRMAELGIDYPRLKAIKPNIVMTSITPFGQSGPYRDFKGCELLSAHMGGVGYASLREQRVSDEPIKLPAHLLSFQAGLSAAVATSAATYRQMLTGAGHFIDVSEQECAMQNLFNVFLYYQYGKQIPSRTDRWSKAPFHILRCKDGYVVHAFVQEYQWRRFVEVMGNPDWAESELFKDYPTRGLYWDALKPLLEDWTMQHTMEEIYRKSQVNGAPIGAVYTAKEILNDRQLLARGFFVEVARRARDSLKYPGVPYRFSGASREQPSAAPLLGQHNEDVYCGQLGYTRAELEKLRAARIV